MLAELKLDPCIELHKSSLMMGISVPCRVTGRAQDPDHNKHTASQYTNAENDIVVTRILIVVLTVVNLLLYHFHHNWY